MNHGEAIQQMMTERYLLDDLTLEEREAFEEHVFDCPECALDLRAGSVFIKEAKDQLPELIAQTSLTAAQPAKPTTQGRGWSSWLKPAFALPAFAVLLVFIAYQNIALIPGLKRAASEPSILPSTAIHLGTRGSAHTSVAADRTEGLALLIVLPPTSAFSSYNFNLYDPSGKQVWTRTLPGSTPDAGDQGLVSLLIPGSGLTEGSYTLGVVGTTPQNNRVEIDRRILDVKFSH